VSIVERYCLRPERAGLGELSINRADARELKYQSRCKSQK
jgi:hypothetical protein